MPTTIKKTRQAPGNDGAVTRNITLYSPKVSGVSLAALGPRSTCCARGAVPLFPRSGGTAPPIRVTIASVIGLPPSSPLFLVVDQAEFRVSTLAVVVVLER